MQHSSACRRRILGELSKTPEGQARLDSYEEPVDRAIADRIEAEDKNAAPAPALPPQKFDDAQPRPEAELTGGSSGSTAAPGRDMGPRVHWANSDHADAWTSTAAEPRPLLPSPLGPRARPQELM